MIIILINNLINIFSYCYKIIIYYVTNFFKEKEYISKDPNELSNYFKVIIKNTKFQEEGNKFFALKDYEVALFYFTKAIETDQNNKIFYSNRCA